MSLGITDNHRIQMDIVSLGTYEIAFPMRKESLRSAVAADGGTLAYSFTDARGTDHNLFVDRRIKTSTRDHFYADSYPKSSDSRYLGYFPEVLTRIEAEVSR